MLIFFGGYRDKICAVFIASSLFVSAGGIGRNKEAKEEKREEAEEGKEAKETQKAQTQESQE